MVEDSDTSDSWGSIANYYLDKMSKTYHVSESKSKIHNGDQDKHLLIGSTRPKGTKKVSKNMVTKRVVLGLQSNRYESGNKFTQDDAIPYPDWCEERMRKGYSQKIILPKSSDSIENKNKVKRKKSLKNSEQKTEHPSENLQTDFIENKIDLVKISLAPVKCSECSPAQVGNEKGRETIPAHTAIGSTVLKSESVEIMDIIESIIESSVLPQKTVENKDIFNEETNLAESVDITKNNEVIISYKSGNKSLNISPDIMEDQIIDIPPLSDFDCKEDAEKFIKVESPVKMDIIDSCAHTDTSNISLKIKSNSKAAKKARRIEVTRPGALLPDNIWLSNHMSCTRMSATEYNSRCKSLKKSCKDSIECKAHVNLKNLQAISSNLRKILSQSTDLSNDWDTEKNIHSGKYGYLNIAVNHPEILRETKTIKQLIRSFNRSREKMWKYKDIILNYHVRKPDFMKCKEPAQTAHQNDSPTMTRLIEKVSPYNEKDFKVISIRAFLSIHMREMFTTWEEDNSKPIILNEAANEVIENLKFEYPKLQKWSNTRIVNRISENWADRAKIQIDLNKEILVRAKSLDLKEREESNPENVIEIDDTKANIKLLDSLIEDESETLNWNKASPLTRYTSEAPAIILDNIEEVTEINICNNDVLIRDRPSLSVLTSYYDHSSRKWLESKRASHPFISVKMTKINPEQNNSFDTSSTTLCLMADSGAMCTLLNHETVRQMGIDPETLETSSVSITGVNGKKLQSQTRQMHVKIVNSKNNGESWEKVLASPIGSQL